MPGPKFEPGLLRAQQLDDRGLPFNRRLVEDRKLSLLL